MQLILVLFYMRKTLKKYSKKIQKNRIREKFTNKIQVLRKYLVIAGLNIKNSSHDPSVSYQPIRNMSKIQTHSSILKANNHCLQLTSLPASLPSFTILLAMTPQSMMFLHKIRWNFMKNSYKVHEMCWLQILSKMSI